MPALQVRLLGRLEILYKEWPLPLPATRKAQVLLAYLILHREQPQNRERLSELFWGDRPDEKARRSLATAVWHISHFLPDEGYILSNSNQVQFNPMASLALDVDKFESLVSCTDISDLHTGLELYRGEFLAGSYEDWIIHERYRLENLYLDGLARLMSAYEASSMYEPALATALHLLNHDTLREEAHRTAMRVYCRLGKRNAALEQYQRCQQIVQQELNTEPMLETNQLYHAILGGQITPAESIQVEQPHLETHVAQHQSGSSPLDLSTLPPFVGRETEMAALDSTWKQTMKNRGWLALIVGEAGVGKTRLAEEFTKCLRWKGVPVLWGRCYEFERILPYQPIAEALRSFSPDLMQVKPDVEKIDFLQELFKLVPELAASYPETALRSETPVELEQARLFKGVSQFLFEIAQHSGLLIVIEDLQWAAESTLELLHYLVRNLVTSPILILGTVRTEELGRNHPLIALQAQLKREGLLHDQHLERLSSMDIESIISKMSGQSEVVLPFAQHLYLETEGNPFFLMETIKALFDDQSITIKDGVWVGDYNQISANKLPLPTTLNDAVRNRIQQLDETTQEVVSVASVIGREFDFDLLKDAWGGKEEQTLKALDILLRRRLVEEGSGSVSRDYSFTHHKIQEVIYINIPNRRRSQIHARIGNILEQTVLKQSYENSGELAFHFYQSRQLNKEYHLKAIHYLLRAGDQARMMYAQKEAIEYYNQALELLKKQGDYEHMAQVNMKLGVTYHNAFEYDQSHKVFEEGFRLWQKVSQFDHPPLPLAPHPLRTNWPAISSIDPAFGMDFAGAIGWQLFSGLVAFNSDLEVMPEAAKKWQLYSGGREYIFHLRNDLRWSDGKPLTAYDFEFSGKRMLAPETDSPMANLLYDIKGARSYHLGETSDPDRVGLRAVDAATLCVELDKPASYFLQLLVNFLAVPRQCIDAFHEKWTDTKCIVTSGPFKLECWEKTDCMQLVTNPNYHGQRNGNIQQVTLNLRPDPRVNVEKYGSGELDVLDLRFYPVAVYEKAIRQFTNEYFSFPAASLSFIGFNTTRSPFQDERLRKAFAMAIDKEMLAGVIQRGSVFPAKGGFIPPGLPGHLPRIGLPYDPERAKELLAQMGYPLGRGFPEVEALTPLHLSDPINEYLTGQWGEILGVTVTWQTVSPGLHLILDSKPADIFLSYWHADYPDPDDFLGASQILRWTGWRDETYLRLLEETKSIVDQSQRIEVFNQADRLLMDTAAIVPISYNRQHFLLKPWVKRYPTSALFSWFWKDVVIEPH